MKTVGELLHRARIDQGVTLEALSRQTNIDIRYIQALENNDFNRLPATTFVKGFIRNISLSLGKDPEEMIAIFRRDYQISPQTRKKSTSAFKLTGPFPISSQILLFALGVFLFFAYLAFQYRTVLIPPKLDIVQPQINQVVVSPITIEGISTVDSVITINDQQEVNTDENGHFLVKINLPVGNQIVKISATNRFGRTSEKELRLTIVSQ